jgi:hypothetical protein
MAPTLSKKTLVMVDNPVTPYILQLPANMKENETIKIVGVPGTDDNRFNINFINAAKFNEGDVMFQFDVRFKYGAVKMGIVCNNRVDDDWQNEEITPFTNTFVPNKRFIIEIDVNKEGYVVSVDGEYCLTFNHRMDFGMANHLAIRGDVNIEMISDN